NFPEDLENLIPNSKSIVYPRYETRGDLNQAVRTLCEWLEERVAEHQTYDTEVVVCLLGHSMGGIVSAEAILAYTDTMNCPVRFIGLFAYDTPFFGVHKNVHTSAVNRVQTATRDALATYSTISSVFTRSSTNTSKSRSSETTSKTVTSKTVTSEAGTSKNKSFGLWGTLATTAAVAVGGYAAYSNREKLSETWKWVGDHLEYVSVLADADECQRRVDGILERSNEIVFRCFYTMIPSADTPSRTFITLPPKPIPPYLIAISNQSRDEIDAHVTMFQPEINKHYNRLLQSTAKLVTKRLEQM
ncbi:7427_t:CDS:2, partial [Paraglomus occultum]